MSDQTVTTDAPTQGVTTAPLAHALSIPHGLLSPSPTNPRKRFDAAALAELAESIAEHGVMQPLAARPNPLHSEGDGRPPYELVCGERRWRACGLLIEQGRHYPADGTVPVLVRPYTDAQVLALQALENVQRQDLHPLEEADHYHLMVTHPLNPATVAEVAQLIGKSTSYVQARLNLRRLGSEAREAFMSGLLDFSKALRVSAMPTAQQPSIVQHITTWGGEPMGVRAAERFIVEQHTLLLVKAPWALDDAQLLPEAGACTDCPQRTDRQPGLFESATDGDRCLNGACWGQKRQAHHDWLVRNAEAEGYVIARGDRAASIMRHDSTTPADGWHDLSARVPAHLGDSTATVEQVIDRANVPAEDITVLDQPSRERLVHLVTTAVLRTALKAIGAAKGDPAPLELLAQQYSAPTVKKQPADASPSATAGEPPRVPAKATPQEASNAPPWNPLDDLLAFKVLPDGRCDAGMAERCRQRAIKRTAAGLSTHRACNELRDRGAQLNALLPAGMAGQICVSLWIGFDFEDQYSATMHDIARLAGIASEPPTAQAGTPWKDRASAAVAWLTGLDRMDATCMAYAMVAHDINELPTQAPWRSVLSTVGIAPDALLAEATQAVDERLRIELLAAPQPTTPKAKAKAAAKAAPQPKPAKKTSAKPAAKAPAKKPPTKTAAAPSVKYRDAATGNTWTGRGLQPAWLKAELAKGAKLSDFEVQA